MKKNIFQTLNKIIYPLFIAATVIILFIVNKNIETKAAVNFAIGYTVYALVVLAYSIVVIIFNMRSLKKSEIKGRVLKFFICVLIILAANFLRAFFAKEQFNILVKLPPAIFISLGITSSDLIFTNKNNA